MLKNKIQLFWEETPCGTREIASPTGGAAFFDRLEAERDQREPFIGDFARFDEQHGRRVLEVGFGAATDFVRFARAGAVLTGIDLTESAVGLARRRLARESLSADVRRGDAERLPFEDGCFDFVYSWGVIHHTENTQQAADEIVRVARPGGEICVMVYHRHSLVALQCWLVYALLRGKPWRSLSDVIWHHVESVGTKAFTVREARRMFSSLGDLEVTTVVTPYDVRLSRSRYLPPAFRALIPARLGWFLVVQGRKRD